MSNTLGTFRKKQLLLVCQRLPVFTYKYKVGECLNIVNSKNCILSKITYSLNGFYYYILQRFESLALLLTSVTMVVLSYTYPPVFKLTVYEITKAESMDPTMSPKSWAP